MRLFVWTGVCLTNVFLSLQQDGIDDLIDGFGQDYLVDELPGQQNQGAFRPKSAKEAMKLASRLAQKDHSQEHGQTYALLQGNSIGGRGVRVAVYDVVDVTTSRYNFPRSRGRFRQAAEWPRAARDGISSLESRTPLQPFLSAQAQQYVNPHPHVHPPQQTSNSGQHGRGGHQRPKSGKSPRQNILQGDQKPKNIKVQKRPKHKTSREKNHRRNAENMKRRRVKREVDESMPEVASNFELPPMSIDWGLKKKKKKKKKKSTTVPPTKTIQKKSKKFRIYMESSELALGKAKGKALNVVQGLSQELEELLKEAGGFQEEYTSSPVVMPTKAKFVPIPKNWQNPPSWKPPTRGSHGASRQVPRGQWRHSENIITIGPQPISEEQTTQPSIEETTTEPDWKNYNHPMQTSRTKEGIELKPAPEDWPEPTHPADGIYDWHKAQIRRGSRNMNPYSSYTYTQPSRTYNNSHFQRYNWNRQSTYMPSWTHKRQPTYSPSWTFHRFSRAPWRSSRGYGGFVPQTTTSWNWAKPAEEERVMLQRNDMWQTRPWVSNIQLTPQPDRSFGQPHEGGAVYRSYSSSYDQTHLTTGPPLTALNAEQGLKDAPLNQQESHQYSYQYSPQHAAWQGSAHGHQGVEGGSQHYNTYQASYTNYTNYYNQYYQHYYGQLANKTAAFFYQRTHHYQDKNQASGVYQSHYSYQSQAEKQSRLKPPAYFYNPHDTPTTIEPLEDINAFVPSHLRPTLSAPHRLYDEYAGNDRDLRAPPPTHSSYSNHPSFRRGWTPSRYKPAPLRRKFVMRGRRVPGVRPTGYRSIFMAPLQRASWNTTAVLPGGAVVTPRVL